MAKKKKRSAPAPIAKIGDLPSEAPPTKKSKPSPSTSSISTTTLPSTPSNRSIPGSSLNSIQQSSIATTNPSGGLSAAAKKKKKKKAAAASAAVLATSLSTIEEVLNFNPPDSATKASAALSWLIHPMDSKTFLSSHWQSQHLLITRPTQPEYYHSLYSSSEDILGPIKAGALRLTADYTVTGYNPETDSKWTLDSSELPAGDSKLETSKVLEALDNGGSIRVLRPQDYSSKVCTLLSALEEAWDAGVAGANSYLTPPPDQSQSTGQGFAPHYDDVDVFILQLEGSKRWRLYPPTQDEERLARFSSDDFSPDDLDEPILDHVLQPGDLLYFPRGTIHQAVTVSPNTPSLHLTLSTGQLQTWADFLGILLTGALEQAESEHIELRQNLPRHWSRSMGVIHSGEDTPSAARAKFEAALQEKLALIFKDPPTDAAADHMAAAYITNRHKAPFKPPALQAALDETKTGTKAAMAALEGNGLLDSDPGAVTFDSLPEEVSSVFHAGTQVSLQGRDLFRIQVNSETQSGEEEIVLTTPGKEDALPLEAAPILEMLSSAYPAPLTLKDMLSGEDVALDLLSLLELLDVLVDRDLLVIKS